jgi:hypothetical protein
MDRNRSWTVEITFDEARNRARATLLTVRPLLVGEGDIAVSMDSPPAAGIAEELAAACALADLAAKLQEIAIRDIARHDPGHGSESNGPRPRAARPSRPAVTAPTIEGSEGGRP